MRNQRLLQLIFSIWIVLLAFYMLQFENFGVIPVICASLLWLSLMLLVYGFLRKMPLVRKFSLVVITVASLTFTVSGLVYIPECGCYSYSWVDFIPVYITWGMLPFILKSE